MVGNLQGVLDRCGVPVVSVREPWLDTGSAVHPLRIAITCRHDAMNLCDRRRRVRLPAAVLRPCSRISRWDVLEYRAVRVTRDEPIPARRRAWGPSVPTSPETVPPRYLSSDGRRMVPQACRSHPKFQVEKAPPQGARASSVSPA